MHIDPGLQSLFVFLRSAGITVGLEEIRRLGCVFATAPALDADELRQVVESICVKSTDEQHAFRRVYGKWLDTIDRQLKKSEARWEHGATEALIKRHKPGMKRKRRPSAEVEEVTEPAEPARLEPMPSFEQSAGGPSGEAGPDITAPMPLKLSQGMHFHYGSQGSGKPDLMLPDTSPAEPVNPGLPPMPATTKATRGFIGLFALLCVAALGWGFYEYIGSVSDGQTVAEVDAGAGDSADPNYPSAGVSSLQTHLPELDAIWPESPPIEPGPYVLMVLGLGFGGWLLWRRARGRWLPEVRRAHADSGTAVIPHGASHGLSGALFLDEEDEENLIWGVGQFVSDEPSRDLDIDATVRETAASFGRPVLRYQWARYHREVWLWVDESIDAPVARHLARDLARTLERSGLPVTISTFWGLPRQLRMEGEEVVNLDALDARRTSAAVAILTDGRLMHAAHRDNNRSPELHDLLRDLSYWPRVTFIDFGRERGRLGAVVEPHGLRVIAPQDAPAAVSDLAEGNERADYGRLVGDARVWAAACALSPRPVDDPTALKLRRILGLEVTPWAIQTLRERAEYRAGGMSWSCRGRAVLLSWLLDVEELPERVMPPPDSLLARIVNAWDRLLSERERALALKSDVDVVANELAQVRMERCFVHLWDRPDEAARRLYELFQGPLAPTIRHHLGQLAPRECADDVDSIPLPWALRDVRRETQVILSEMGIGAHAKLGGRNSLPMPGRLALALALCAGVAVGSGYAVVEDYTARADSAPEAINEWPSDERPALVDVSSLEDGAWMVSAHMPWSAEPTELRLRSGQNYRLRAVEAQLACVDTIPSGGGSDAPAAGPDGAGVGQRGSGGSLVASGAGEIRVHRCCRDREVVERTEFTDRWSFAVLREVPYAADLAEMLLCSGTADATYIVPPTVAMPDWSDWAREADDAQLLLVDESVPESLERFRGRAVTVSTFELGKLLEVTQFDGAATLAERVPKLSPLAGDAEQFLVAGMGACGGVGEPCCSPNQIFEFCEQGLDCGADKTCVPARICEPGTARCEGNALLRCGGDGTSEESAACGADERCIAGACRAGLAGGAALVVGFAVVAGGDAVAARDLRLWCAVGDSRAQWSGADLLAGRSRDVLVPLSQEIANKPLEVSCWLTKGRRRWDEQRSRHSWQRLERAYEFAFQRMPGLRVSYRFVRVPARLKALEGDAPAPENGADGADGAAPAGDGSEQGAASGAQGSAGAASGTDEGGGGKRPAGDEGPAKGRAEPD
ncbi:MAG: hypothetical protein Tsb0020_06600 [Haliangiales bacterium]